MIGRTYFADSPVVIKISGLEWPDNPPSPFTIVHLRVKYKNSSVGNFVADTGGQSETVFDISSALRAIWAGYDFSKELPGGGQSGHAPRAYSLIVWREYLFNGNFTTSQESTFDGGKCLPGRFTETERTKGIGDVSSLSSASTKPTTSPERVGRDSMTSVVEFGSGGTTNTFYTANAQGSPAVLRDSQPYVDFLFVNKRGAVETCSALVLESEDIDVDVQQYARVERPSFVPSRSLMAIGTDGRRQWSMSSGFVDREWAEWWTQDFLAGKRKLWWMRYPLYDPNGSYVPVVVKPAKQSISIYDRSKQQMPHVEFTVTMALEG